MVTTLRDYGGDLGAKDIARFIAQKLITRTPSANALYGADAAKATKGNNGIPDDERICPTCGQPTLGDLN